MPTILPDEAAGWYGTLRPDLEYSPDVKRSVWIVLGAVVVVGLVVVALLVNGAIRKPTADPTQILGQPPSAQLPDGTLLPQERTIVAKAQPDGHLLVTETIVFDAADGSPSPLLWYLGGVRIGWFTDDRSQQYGVIPSLVTVAAQEIAPKTRAKTNIAVTQEKTGQDDPYSQTQVFRTRPDGGWTKGQHAVTLTYELADVYLTANGTTMAVLPLSFFGHPDSSRQSLNVTRVTVTGAKKLRCLQENRDFVDQEDCSGSTATLRYHGDEYNTSIDAVAFVDPSGVTAQPAPAPVRKN